MIFPSPFTLFHFHAGKKRPKQRSTTAIPVRAETPWPMKTEYRPWGPSLYGFEEEGRLMFMSAVSDARFPLAGNGTLKIETERRGAAPLARRTRPA
jgi:hypothetical protein